MDKMILCEKLSDTFDVAKIRELSEEILAKLNCSDDDIIKKGGFQVSLVHRKDVYGDKRLFDGIRANICQKTLERLAYEEEFQVFNTDYKETHFFDIYKRVQEIANGRARRMRLMWLAPKRNYLVHADKFEVQRFHLAINSNENNFFVYPKEKSPQVIQIPTDGHLYCINAGKEHTFVNASNAIRLHILITTVNEL